MWEKQKGSQASTYAKTLFGYLVSSPGNAWLCITFNGLSWCEVVVHILVFQSEFHAIMKSP